MTIKQECERIRTKSGVDVIFFSSRKSGRKIELEAIFWDDLEVQDSSAECEKLFQVF